MPADILCTISSPKTAVNMSGKRNPINRLPRLSTKDLPLNQCTQWEHCVKFVGHTCAWTSHIMQGSGRIPCPNSSRPLHHLIRVPWRETVARTRSNDSRDVESEVYVFQCSATQCPVIVTIQLRAPVLTPALIHTLTDRDLIKQRTDETFLARPSNVEGKKRPGVYDVLNNLRSWHRDALTRKSKPVPVWNTRFILSFGPQGRPCEDVFFALDFKLQVCSVVYDNI